MTFQNIKRGISIALLCALSIVSLFILFNHINNFIESVKQIIEREKNKTKQKNAIPNKDVIVPDNNCPLYSLSETFELLFSKEILETEKKNEITFIESIAITTSTEKNPLNLFTYPTKVDVFI